MKRKSTIHLYCKTIYDFFLHSDLQFVQKE